MGKEKDDLFGLNLLQTGPLPIEGDAGRFRQIVRGQIKKELKKYMSNGELIGRQGKDLISIPVPQIDLPHFRFGNGRGGVGQGEGAPGTPLGPGQPKDGGKQGPGGREQGNHILEAWELVEMAIQELKAYVELPDLLPLPGDIVDKIFRMKGVTTNPTGFVDRKRTIKKIWRKATTDPNQWPAYMGNHDMKVYKDFREVPKPGKNALVMYILDVSGSIDQKKREIIRTSMFWTDKLLTDVYEGNVKSACMAHDSVPYFPLTIEEALGVRTGGGTIVSTALETLLRFVQENPTANIFTFYYGDGENSGHDDDVRCGKLLRQLMTEHFWFRGFYYSQVRPSSFSSDLLTELRIASRGLNTGLGTGRFVDATVNELDEILKGILTLVGKPGAVKAAGLE